MEALRVTGLSKTFDSTRALKNVSFAAEAGAVLAVCGENGAGKSTLMKILGGAFPPDSGEIHLAGTKIELGSPHQAIEKGFRTVYQEASLLPHLSVAENLFLGRMPSGKAKWLIDWKRTRKAASLLLADFGLAYIDADTRTSRLPVSVQQIIEIAKALIDRPRILILDEPTAVLSARETSILFAKVREMAAAGTTVLYISHRLEEIFEISDRILVLKDGAAVLHAKTQETSRDTLIQAMVGRALSAIYPQRQKQSGDIVFAARGLSKQGIFTDIDLSIGSGEIVGMFGLVGSGRTDVVKAIFGAAPADEGEILIAGKPATLGSPQEAIAHGIALVTEDRKHDGLALELNAIANGGLASMPAVSRHGILNRSAEAARVGSKLDQLAVRPRDPTRSVRQFSGGNQQKIVLAKWLLVGGVRLFIFDEPTRGVDIATKVEIYRIMAELAGSGAGILLVSSEMPEIMGMSDRILVMRQGRLVAELPRSEVTMEMLFAHAAGVDAGRKTA